MPQQRSELIDRTLAALTWIAAFAFAGGIFLASTLLLRALPPTPLVAVGRVTVERASKARDYAGALLFFVLIAPLTVAFYRAAEAELRRLRRKLAFRKEAPHALVALLFISPFFLAPFLFLTTQKWGWPILIPLALGAALPRVLIAYETKAWIRQLYRRELLPFHTLIIALAAAWIVFRYIATGKRIAHIPTLFLEITFVVFIVVVFEAAFVLIARLAAMTLHTTQEIALQRASIAALPIVVLPLLALLLVNGAIAIAVIMAIIVVAIPVGLIFATPVDGRAVRRATIGIVIPLLLYCTSYVSLAATWQSIDLFHRGESLGPASDYARGKVPYRDVFVLHGLMHDGLLDGWLLQLFGRDETIVLARPAVLGAFAAPAMWFLGVAIFDSVPLAALMMLLGAVTTTDTERAFFEIVAVALFIAALRRASNMLFAASGFAAAVALFFSLDIGLYSIGGAVLAMLVLRRFRAVVPFLAGVAAGAAPFVIYLAVRGGLGAFFVTSFRVIPSIIDAVWSLPFPDLTDTFRQNLNLHTISDFVLFERFRFILNPLIIGIAIIVIVRRAMTGKRAWVDLALVALTSFAVLTQRSALGRADFQHQYFSAFLIAPILAIFVELLLRAPRALALAGVGALFPLVAVTLWVPDLVNWRLDDVTHYAARVRRREYVDPAAEEIRQRIREVRDSVSHLSREGDAMFDFSNQPALYFFCDRPNPTRFYQVPVMSPREFQREVIVALERARPPVVIRRSPQEFDQFDGIDNSVRAQAVAAYLDDHYTYADTRYGVEIWKRRAALARADVDRYLRNIRVPTARALGGVGNRGRVVFPWMTSESGGAGTYWRSDLTLHNPSNTPMSLRLRYVAGDTRVDRQISLAPQRSIRWDDVVDSLFHARGTGGVAWIEYRGDRPPVARAQTFDVAHDRGGSIAEPLSVTDSAAAGTPRDQLSVLGFSSNHVLINLGVVNIGQTPMAFRLTITAADGTPVGKSLEQTVGEDQAFVLTDAEEGLSVKLDPTMTARMRVLSGRAVAFATTIERNGDTEFLAGVPSSQK